MKEVEQQGQQARELGLQELQELEQGGQSLELQAVSSPLQPQEVSGWGDLEELPPP